VYTAPYGEDPIDMLKILNDVYGVGAYLKSCLPELRKLRNSRMPDNIFAKQYYDKVINEIERL